MPQLIQIQPRRWGCMHPIASPPNVFNYVIDLVLIRTLWFWRRVEEGFRLCGWNCPSEQQLVVIAKHALHVKTEEHKSTFLKEKNQCQSVSTCVWPGLHADWVLELADRYLVFLIFAQWTRSVLFVVLSVACCTATKCVIHQSLVGIDSETWPIAIAAPNTTYWLLCEKRLLVVWHEPLGLTPIESPGFNCIEHAIYRILSSLSSCLGGILLQSNFVTIFQDKQLNLLYWTFFFFDFSPTEWECQLSSTEQRRAFQEQVCWFSSILISKYQHFNKSDAIKPILPYLSLNHLYIRRIQC